MVQLQTPVSDDDVDIDLERGRSVDGELQVHVEVIRCDGGRVGGMEQTTTPAAARAPFRSGLVNGNDIRDGWNSDGHHCDTNLRLSHDGHQR
jgi:hypothetical protein